MPERKSASARKRPARGGLHPAPGPRPVRRCPPPRLRPAHRRRCHADPAFNPVPIRRQQNPFSGDRIRRENCLAEEDTENAPGASVIACGPRIGRLRGVVRAVDRMGVVVMNPLVPDRMNRNRPRHGKPSRTQPREHPGTDREPTRAGDTELQSDCNFRVEVRSGKTPFSEILPGIPATGDGPATRGDFALIIRPPPRYSLSTAWSLIRRHRPPNENVLNAMPSCGPASSNTRRR